MLLANPSLEELYHKSCALAEDPQEVRDSFQHPARLIKACQTLFYTFTENGLTVIYYGNHVPLWRTLNVEISWLLVVLCK